MYLVERSLTGCLGRKDLRTTVQYCLVWRHKKIQENSEYVHEIQ